VHGGRPHERAIAEELNISERAVDTSVASIFKKLALPPMGDDRRRILAMLFVRS
jgi:DNA-binding NarL/FixJ family response regulator